MEKIIELVRKYPILYDLSHEDYKNTRKKDKVWSTIGEEIGENGEEIKTKWRNLRDTYAMYIRGNKTKTGQAATNSKKLIWADHMEAFKLFLNFAKTTSNVSDICSKECTAMTNMPPENIEMFETSELEQTTSSQNLQETQLNNPQMPNRDISQLYKKTNRKRNSEPSTSVKDMMTYFKNKKKITYDATDQLFLAHACENCTESSLNSSYQPASTDSYPNISSVESISVASLDSPNVTAFPRQLETSEYYNTSSTTSENNYSALTNVRNQPASNYLNSFNPYISK
ncbi:hypothetical protein ABEB36_009341 [Hypothenemus hampei]|uniref:MADF domain-containing protein n=1 Tax=Hypothenemus hampei TaxID=57062 RepID=A0ABD1EGP3_HYPHA